MSHSLTLAGHAFSIPALLQVAQPAAQVGLGALDIPKILGYGALGFGAILAVLAFRLLRREQDQTAARPQIVHLIYAYLSFALLLSVLGFGAEIYRDKTVRQRDQRIVELEATLAKSREILLVLLDQKGGKVQRLTAYDPSNQDFPQILEDIKSDLTSLDSVMRSVLDEH